MLRGELAAPSHIDEQAFALIGVKGIITCHEMGQTVRGSTIRQRGARGAIGGETMMFKIPILQGSLVEA